MGNIMSILVNLCLIFMVMHLLQSTSSLNITCSKTRWYISYFYSLFRSEHRIIYGYPKRDSCVKVMCILFDILHIMTVMGLVMTIVIRQIS